MRNISLSGVSDDVAEREDLEAGGQRSLPLYDTSGPYTDSTANIDIRLGLRPIREAWIREREDAELLDD
jgi:phosphomethylpyrimidine synthase